MSTAPYPEYADLWTRAEASVRADHGFVDPAKMRRAETLGRGRDWQIAVLGHARPAALVELHLLLLAHADDVTPPLPEDIVRERARHAEKVNAERAAHATVEAARCAEWKALVAALPVPVGVAYNYSGPNHYETWTQGAVHIIVREFLSMNRLTRQVGNALCTTDSNRRHQIFADQDDPQDRHPSCKACLRIACRLTGLSAPTLLTTTKGR